MNTDPILDPTDPDVFYCARHPNIETVLRCNRCDTPICPRCLVQTPVGAKCPTCANVSRIPTVDIKPEYLARGLAAGVVSGAVVGYVWGSLLAASGIVGFILIFIAIGMGVAVSEAISVATNRKRAAALEACCVIGMVIAYFVHNTVAYHALIVSNDIWGVLAAGFAAYYGAQRLKP